MGPSRLGPPRWLVILALLVVQTGFGAYGVVVAKFAVKHKANPLIFSVVRDACCFPVLLLAAFVAEKRLLFPRLREMPMFALLGFLGMFGNQLFYILGVYYAGPNISSAFQPAIPVWAAFFALLLRVEKLPSVKALHFWTKMAGIFLAAAGAVGMTVLKPSSSSSKDSSNSTSAAYSGDCKSSSSTPSEHDKLIGCIFLIVNTVAMAFYVLAQKKLVFQDREFRWSDVPFNVTAWCYFWGAVFMALASPAAILVQPSVCGHKASPWDIPIQTTYPIEYAIFVASALCYLLITWCTMLLSATLVTAFWPFQVRSSTCPLQSRQRLSNYGLTMIVDEYVPPGQRQVEQVTKVCYNSNVSKYKSVLLSAVEVA